MPNSVIKSGAYVEYSIIGERCTVGENAHVGEKKTDDPEWGVAVVGSDKIVPDGEIIAAKVVY
jgi:glucose-1-phosphate adenylyltransferase